MSVLSETAYDVGTVAWAAAIMREAVQDKSYELLPIGQDVAVYLRQKRKRLTPSSYVSYESSLDKLARYFAELRLEDLEPPRGTILLEEFLDHRWGDSAPRTYNANLSMITDFFKFQRRRGRMVGDPCDAIERAKKREVYRTTYSESEIQAIIAANQHDIRDRLALRLLLRYGLRKGALAKIQFRHFDHNRQRLTIFTKGETVRPVPIPDPAFWHDLERHILDDQVKPTDFLMCRHVGNKKGLRRIHDEPMSGGGLHRWWYRCLRNAGFVGDKVLSGERMHKARHTSGQRLLDVTGNLVAVKNLLGHKSISTTADVYVDWDIDQLAASLVDVLSKEDDK